jgi:hypothetical protein
MSHAPDGSAFDPPPPEPPHPSALAAERAFAFLLDALTQPERSHLLDHGYIDVTSPSRPERTYRVARKGGFVWVYEHERPVEWLCIQPVDALPGDDVVLIHRLYIQASEDEYLRKACHYSLVGPMSDVLIRRMAEVLDVPWEHNLGGARAPLLEKEQA